MYSMYRIEYMEVQFVFTMHSCRATCVSNVFGEVPHVSMNYKFHNKVTCTTAPLNLHYNCRYAGEVYSLCGE